MRKTLVATQLYVSINLTSDKIMSEKLIIFLQKGQKGFNVEIFFGTEFKFGHFEAKVNIGGSNFFSPNFGNFRNKKSGWGFTKLLRIIFCLIKVLKKNFENLVFTKFLSKILSKIL
jgi:hypothetical protein